MSIFPLRFSFCMGAAKSNSLSPHAFAARSACARVLTWSTPYTLLNCLFRSNAFRATDVLTAAAATTPESGTFCDPGNSPPRHWVAKMRSLTCLRSSSFSAVTCRTAQARQDLVYTSDTTKSQGHKIAETLSYTRGTGLLYKTSLIVCDSQLFLKVTRTRFSPETGGVTQTPLSAAILIQCTVGFRALAIRKLSLDMKRIKSQPWFFVICLVSHLSFSYDMN